MVSRAQQLPPDIGSVMRRIRQLETEVRQLRAAQRATGTTIDTGGITLTGGGGVTVEDGGNLTAYSQSGSQMFDIATYGAAGAQYQESVRIGRIEDGTTALQTFNFAGPGQTAQTLVLYDHSGNILYGDDYLGWGMGRPYIGAGGWIDLTGAAPPTSSTTSTTFANLQSIAWYEQHPRVYVSLVVKADASTAGQIRLSDVNGVQIGSTLALSAGAYAVTSIGPATLTNPAYADQFPLYIQGRVTSGTGRVYAQGGVVWGVSSP
jgi:hypothetical protein